MVRRRKNLKAKAAAKSVAERKTRKGIYYTWLLLIIVGGIIGGVKSAIDGIWTTFLLGIIVGFLAGLIVWLAARKR